MPVYSYRAKKGPKDIVEDTIEAPSEKEAFEKISRMGYIPVRIQEGGVSPLAVSNAPKSSRKVRPREITVFSRQLASLIRSGVPILDALNIIREQADNRRMADMISGIHDMIKEGDAFSGALSRYPGVFSRLYIAMIKTGEDSGTLPETLLRICEYRSKQEEMVSKLRTAMAYPALMAVVGAGTVIFMLTFVMPRLMNIFTTLGEGLPLPTVILLKLSMYLRQWWIWVVVALLVVLIRQQLKMKAMKLPLSRLKLRVPLLGDFVLKAELARFSRTLELLIRNGIPILRAMDIAIPVLDNQTLRNQLDESRKELEQGGSLGASLKSSKVFPVFMANLISVGEESGRLDEALAEVADSYERDTDEAIKIISSLLEPVMILVMGLIVGFIVVSMLLPVFQINFMAR
ncbi:MAG: type II secretion system F family protein [Candidatus Omnitrophota bacterium]|jgi:type II secretory pathway component PulF